MGASNKNAQDNIQPKGNKKPLQVLHISKKDSQEINNEQNNSQEDIKKENIAIKPQIIKDNSEKEKTSPGSRLLPINPSKRTFDLLIVFNPTLGVVQSIEADLAI